MKAVLRAGKPEIFWAMVERDMKRSTAFRLSAINSVIHGWYKSEDIQKVYNICFGVDKILSENIVELKYFRVEIPKGDPAEVAEFFKNNPGAAWPGKTRPLGVPTAPWRVVLHMWNGFLTLFLEEELKKFNHAYMPGVGTKTAIEHFITDVRNHKYIYEFDIKGFFNNVSVDQTAASLFERGMPYDQVNKLYIILMRSAANLHWDELDQIESEYDKQLALRKAARNIASYYEGLEGYDPFEEGLQTTLETGNVNKYSVINKGLPQGAAPSTILSILALSDWYKKLEKKGIKLLMYADDGLLYSDKNFFPFPPEGFEFADEKSRWIRKDKPITDEVKFLGVIYNFTTEMIKGATRKGSKLEFGVNQENLLKMLASIIPSGHSMDIIGSLVRSNIFGLALSKLYGGKFGRLQYEEHVEYNSHSYWAKNHDLDKLKRDRETQRIASSISCGWLLHLVDHSMGKVTRKKFRQASLEYHLKKKWEKEVPDERDTLAAYKWQETWEKKHW